MSLHRILTLFVFVLAALAVGAAVSLVVLTSYLHRTTVELETGLQSVRVAEGMQVDLLNYIRSHDDSLRATLEVDLRQKFEQARQFANDPEEQELLSQAEQLTEGHFTKRHQFPSVDVEDGNLEDAFSMLRRFVDINIQQAENSMRTSDRWDELGDTIGIGFSAILLVGMASMIVWLSRVAFQPVFEIQAAIRNFAMGRKDTRAPEHGPEELRIIARQFNEMAVALSRQYDNQLSFIAAVAHDLRNPLTALKSAADILSSGRDLSPETISNILAIIKRQVYGMDRMIGDLLDTSRIEAGRLDLRLKECDVRNVIQAAFDLFKSASTDHALTLSLPDTPVPIRCDPLRIEQVLNNLISNSVKYSPHGGSIEVCLEHVNHQAVIRVVDRGVGIAEKDLPFIFEPFRRTAASREEVPGVGLGLSVANRIVRAHGGHIQVESQVGSGTTFRVVLPALRSKKLTA
jgi:signal transduction histidine kinase